MTLPDAKYPMLRLVNGYTLAVSRPRPPSRFSNAMMISNVTLYEQEYYQSSSFHSKTSIFFLGSRSCTDGLGSTLSGHSFPETTYVILVLILSARSRVLYFPRCWGWSGAYPSTSSSTSQLLLRLYEVAELEAGAAIYRGQGGVFLVAAQGIAEC